MRSSLAPRRLPLPQVSDSRTAALSTLRASPSIKLKDIQRTPGRRTTRIDGPVDLDYGGSLPHVEVAWEQWGDPSLPPSRTVYILPSFSNSSHVVRSLGDPSPGWWEGMVGPGLYIDTNRFRVVSASNLGGPFGTTSPISDDPSTGAPYRLNFPQITPGDVARVHRMLMQQVRRLSLALRCVRASARRACSGRGASSTRCVCARVQLGLEKVHAVIGCSMGGMTGIAFASLYPDAVSRLGVVACTAKTTPVRLCTACSVAQRTHSYMPDDSSSSRVFHHWCAWTNCLLLCLLGYCCASSGATAGDSC